MAIKKSDLYSSLWASCDELRGGMDASQYKDYVLFMLFIKYISDKYADSDDFAPPVVIPPGAAFRDMTALKGKSDIGDKINTQIIQPLIEKNDRLARSDFPDFNDPNKLGEGQAMIDRLTNLVAIFQRPELDFSKNRAEHDDILGDAYEYLMRHFATQSGKSKGQFYTPAEVSRIMAKVIGISPENTRASTTVHDPTCGSGSLLLKVAAQAGQSITLEGQEMDVTTAGLARMNMILHNFPGAVIASGNTLASPKFKDGEALRTYDYVVANPPFSDKTWSTGLTPANDPYGRFGWGEPPTKQGDYAYLLHIIRALKSGGKAACILPHGVLFRGQAQAGIRRRLVESGILKGIIGLPANLFYGTGIPACILILDKENAAARKGIFIVDASHGFLKDGPKNRLREQDIHRIVDSFGRGQDVPGYARLVPFEEIADPKNGCNLNLPRYIEGIADEDLQSIDGHLRGGIPARDIEALQGFWKEIPGVRAMLFEPGDRAGYFALRLPLAEVKPAIFGHSEFRAFEAGVWQLFEGWQAEQGPRMKGFAQGDHPKEFIETLSEDLLGTFGHAPLLDAYDLYQHAMDFWAAAMQDDCYLISADGWKAETYRIVEEVKAGQKKGQKKDRGWACDLVPKPLLVARYFASQQAAIDADGSALESAAAQLAELSEEFGGEEGALKDVATRADAEAAYRAAVLRAWSAGDPSGAAAYQALQQEAKAQGTHLLELSDQNYFLKLKNARGKLSLKSVKDQRNAMGFFAAEGAALEQYIRVADAEKTALKRAETLFEAAETQALARLEDAKASGEPLPDDGRDLDATMRFLELLDKQSELKTQIAAATKALDDLAYAKYPQLCEAEIQVLVVEDKWLAALGGAVRGELERVSQTLTGRVRVLAARYETPLPQIQARVEALGIRVEAHLKQMGAKWN